MSTQDLLAVAVDLYGLLPGEFVESRDERAKQARADGEADLARDVKALRKPTAAAWLVNAMVRHMTEQIEQVLELGQAMREAQEDLDAAELRTLNRQRRQLVTAVVRQGRKVGAELGQKVNDVAAEQAAATLQAAMADENAEAALRTGLLLEPMTTTGLDPVDLTGVLAVPEALGERAPRQAGRKTVGGRRKTKTDAAAALRAEIARVEQEEQEAERRSAETERELRSAEDTVHRLEARVLQLRSEVEELRRQLDEREHALTGAEGRLDDAEDARESAASAHDDAETAVEEVRDRLARLREQQG
ncbi:hypothetical protein ATJ97_3148 [Georgenia soli]|uniref:Uncharacterized protein n=1 Tax=Georgenia soli TaxID=638953 RepID=A0A2A9EPT7_9MICO|nr:hypothetical protein [Georgenia soli]PFG40616.1 hypothetical protein ATJ97_3148 [Georgenia soli]